MIYRFTRESSNSLHTSARSALQKSARFCQRAGSAWARQGNVGCRRARSTKSPTLQWLGQWQSLRSPRHSQQSPRAAEDECVRQECSSTSKHGLRPSLATGRPCRQPHQQQKQRSHDDGSQTPDLGDSRGYALRGLCGPPEQSNSGRIILNACGGESFTTALRVGASPSQLQQVTVTQCGAVRPRVRPSWPQLSSRSSGCHRQCKPHANVA
jgi:hypothetical protein